MKRTFTMTPSPAMAVERSQGAFWQLALLAVGTGLAVSLLAAGVVLFITTVGV